MMDAFVARLFRGGDFLALYIKPSPLKEVSYKTAQW
jgi:hypothetical protein